MNRVIKDFLAKRLPIKGKAFMVFILITAVGLTAPQFAYAAWQWLSDSIAWLLLLIAGIIGELTITLIGLLVDVAQFNNFID